MVRWEFVTTRPSMSDAKEWTWRWRRIPGKGPMEVSDRSFESFQLCVDDARLRGYGCAPDED